LGAWETQSEECPRKARPQTAVMRANIIPDIISLWFTFYYDIGNAQNGGKFHIE
jgi:hypothetical protein